MHVTGVMHPAEIRRVGKARSWDIRCSRVPALGDGMTRALPSRCGTRDLRRNRRSVVAELTPEPIFCRTFCSGLGLILSRRLFFRGRSAANRADTNRAKGPEFPLWPIDN